MPALSTMITFEVLKTLAKINSKMIIPTAAIKSTTLRFSKILPISTPLWAWVMDISKITSALKIIGALKIHAIIAPTLTPSNNK